MTPAALGELLVVGIAPTVLDQMSFADLASWRSVLGAYHEALDLSARRG